MNIQNDQDTLDSTQQAALQFVAGQCPFAGGEAVFQARALLSDTLVYDDAGLCDTSSQKFEKPKDLAPPPLAFRLYPNPSNGFTIVEMEREATEDGEVAVFNTLGEQVLTERFKEGATAILLDLTEQLGGIYYLTLRTKAQSSSKVFFNLK